MTTASSALAGASIGKISVPAASVIPQGVGAPPPPGLDPKKGKLMCIKVRMLDDSVGVFHLGHKALGQALFDEVCRHLNLLECDYFGLEFLDCFGNRCWLDKEKSILKQITLARSDARFYFVVKFYTPTPADLEEEYTRYLFALQIKRDLATGQFVCNENTAALMASYIVQSECGDFSPLDYHDHSYLSAVRFVPNQSAEFEKKVMENHKRLNGMSPAESDLALLETARRSEFYGVRFHAARDIEGTPIALAVLHLGFKVYHQLTCVSTFSWAKLRKLSFKRKKLLIKLLPESVSYYKDTIEFSFDTRNECKMFWKKAVEHHAFFRCSDVISTSRHHSKFFTKGSSFRYCGRTQKQLIDYLREHHKRREPFTRPLLSSKTKKVNGERLLPTPVSSLPGTLTRGNGALSIAPIEFQEETNITEGYEQLPPYADVVQAEQGNMVYESGEELDTRESTEYYSQSDTSVPPMPNVIPPTPDTPQLKRKAMKSASGNETTSAAATGGTKQQITFHFPVTEISPDSPSSSSEFALTREGGGSAGAVGQQTDEWAAPPSPTVLNYPPLSPGGEDGPGEEDNVSEDSYHLAEHELTANTQRINTSYVSTSLPAAAIRSVGGSKACTCTGHESQSDTSIGERPKAAASLDVVYPSDSSATRGFQRRNVPEDEQTTRTVAHGDQNRSGFQIQRPEFPESVEDQSIQQSPTRGLPGPLPGRVIQKGPVIIARAKPIPPPKPKMGLTHLERTARGEHSAMPGALPTEPVVVSRSTVTTVEITTKKLGDVYEPTSKMGGSVWEQSKSNQVEEVPSVEKTKSKDISSPPVVSKRVAFVLPGSPRSAEPDKDNHSPTPPMTTVTAFPPEPELVPTVPQYTQPMPTIEVQSEECPEIRHKFLNGDIPYILHVRHVKKKPEEERRVELSSGGPSATFITFKQPGQVETETETPISASGATAATPAPAVASGPAPGAASGATASTYIRETTSSSRDSSETPVGGNRRTVGRRKSFDLVPRKRLPSPASFSSQDHSVSPDSEHDVTGFVSKFRGVQQIPIKVGQSMEGTKQRNSKRNDPRRLTQPIAPSKLVTVKPKPTRSHPCIPGAGDDDEDSADELIGVETPSLHEGMDLLENLDTADMISVDVVGDIEAPLERTDLETGTVGDTPFIDDRTSSESLVSADYDNLPPMKKNAEDSEKPPGK